jgi:hypothetical protein
MFFSTAANHITMISRSDVVTNWRVVRKDGAAEENVLNMMLWKAERVGPTGCVGAECSESYLTHYYDIKRLKGEIFK